jgi:hypothetical protein
MVKFILIVFNLSVPYKKIIYKTRNNPKRSCKKTSINECLWFFHLTLKNEAFFKIWLKKVQKGYNSVPNTLKKYELGLSLCFSNKAISNQ